MIAMYNNFVPTDLLSDADRLIADLKALNNKPLHCPFCQNRHFYLVHVHPKYYRCKACQKGFNSSFNTPFYRLTPVEHLPIIAIRRLCGQNLTMIRQELDCSAVVIKHRINVIDSYMQNVYPLLYEWYQHFIQEPKTKIPSIIDQQVTELKDWINQQLNVTDASCPYCSSKKTERIGIKRAQFRCHQCWRYFSHLKGSGLEHLRHTEKWFAMIDNLVMSRSYEEIQQELNVSRTTVMKHHKVWLKIIQHRGLFVLKDWIIGRRNSHLAK